MNSNTLINTCSDNGLATILMVVQRIMLAFEILVPIIAIVSLIRILFQSMLNPDNKKFGNWKGVKNWFLALFTVFMIPIAVNFVMILLDESFTVSSCWNYAKQRYNQGEATYFPDGSEAEGKTKIAK